MDRFEPSQTYDILDLKKNLLSLGALKARGYKFSGVDGGIKVIKAP